jgi:hypothetical protein
LKLDPALSAKIIALADANPGKPIDAGMLRDDDFERDKAVLAYFMNGRSTDVEEPKQGKSKYRNIKVEADGRTFDSKKEFRRWLDLRDEQAAGSITDLRHHKEIPIEVNGVEVCKYVADFVYFRGGIRMIEDVKSPATRKIAVYRLKVKLLAAMGIEVQEV